MGEGTKEKLVPLIQGPSDTKELHISRWLSEIRKPESLLAPDLLAFSVLVPQQGDDCRNSGMLRYDLSLRYETMLNISLEGFLLSVISQQTQESSSLPPQPPPPCVMALNVSPVYHKRSVSLSIIWHQRCTDSAVLFIIFNTKLQRFTVGLLLTQIG